MTSDSPYVLPLLVLGLVVIGILTWRRPIAGLFIYFASVGLDYLLALAGFSAGSNVSLGQGMLIILALVAGGRFLTRPEPIPGGIMAVFASIGFFVLALWSSTSLAYIPRIGLMPSAILTATAALPFVLYVVIDRRSRLDSLFWALGLGATLAAGIGCLQFAEVIPTLTAEQREGAEDTRGVVTEYQGTPGASKQGTRYAGPTRNPNGFATVLMGGIPALFFLVTTRRRAIARLAALLALGVCCFALLLTMSRTHIVAFALFALLLTVFSPSASVIQRIATVGIGVVALVAFTVALFQLEGVGERLRAGFVGGGDDSAYARSSVMWGGVLAFANHPIFGIGLANTQYAGFNPTFNASHDIVSTLLGELGGTGTFAFLLIVAASYRLLATAAAVLASSHQRDEGIAFLRIAILICLISGTGDPTIDGRTFWTLVGATLALGRLSLVQGTADEDAGAGAGDPNDEEAPPVNGESAGTIGATAPYFP